MIKINIKNGIINDIFSYEERKKKYQEEREHKIITNSVSDAVINSIKFKPVDKLTGLDKKLLSIRESIDNEYNSSIEYIDSCLELREIPYNGKEFDSKIQTLVPKFNVLNGYVEKTYELNIDKYKILSYINELKKKLSSTDYIVIKSYEAKLSNEDMPYTQEYLDKVFAERKEQREKINYLSDLIK